MKPLVGQDRKKWIVFSASHHLFWGCSYSSFSLPSSLCREPWRGAVGKQRVKEDYEFSCASGTRIVPASASSSSHITFGMLPEDGQVRSHPESWGDERAQNMLQNRGHTHKAVLLPFCCAAWCCAMRTGGLPGQWSVCWLCAQRKCLFVYMGEREA